MESLSTQLTEALAENQDAEGQTEEETLEGGLDESQEAAEEETEAAAITNLVELAEANEWDVEDLYALMVEMPDNADPISLGKVKDEITQSRRANAQLQQQVQDQTAQLQQAQAYRQQGQAADQQVMQANSNLQALQAQAQAVNWAEIEKDDSGRAALMQQKFQAAIGQAQGQLQQAQQQSQQRKQMQHNQYLQQGQTYLRESIPEWRDDKVATAEQAEIASMLVEAGYPQQMVSTIDDPIAIKLARRLLVAEKQLATGKKTAGTVRESAKRTLRGGALGAGADKVVTKKLSDRAKKSGSRSDIMAAARALTGVRK